MDIRIFGQNQDYPNIDHNCNFRFILDRNCLGHMWSKIENLAKKSMFGQKSKPQLKVILVRNPAFSRKWHKKSKSNLR